MHPTIVDGGLAAIDAMERAHAAGKPFPLALIDYQMPDVDGFGLAERVQQRSALGTTMIMMLSSVGQRGDTVRLRELGIAAYLTKPVRQSVLLDAILAVLSGKRQAEDRSQLVTTPSSSDVRRALHILVAEDNAVNSKFVRAMLEKYGHIVVAVENGRQALAALDEQVFDLVLMDVQMPDMDGFVATSRSVSRRREPAGTCRSSRSRHMR